MRDAATAAQCARGAGAVNPEFRQLEDNAHAPRSVRDHVVGAVVFIVLAALFVLVARWRGLTC